jgi:hypothetical protein
MTTTRHPVRVELDGIEAIFTMAAIRKDIEWMEKRIRFLAGTNPDAELVDAIVLKALRNAIDKLDRATYGDESLADGDHYLRPPAGCTCSQSWDAKHAPGCLLFEDVRGWDDTRASA